MGDAASAAPDIAARAAELAAAESRAAQLQSRIDALYAETFAGVELEEDSSSHGARLHKLGATRPLRSHVYWLARENVDACPSFRLRRSSYR